MPLPVRSNVSLQGLNTLAVDARASYLVTVENDTELQEALGLARDKGLPVLIVGGGSNLVITSNFDGLVIHLESRGIVVQEEGADQVRIVVEAGENWHQLVSYTLAQGWYGLENLALIPGTVGAAPVQNIGAYGVELSALCVSLEVIDIATGKLQRFSNEDCQFGYRQSVFKGERAGQYVITRVCLQLSKHPQLHVSYPGLRRYLLEQTSLFEADFDNALTDGRVAPEQVFNAVCELRRSKLPDPSDIPNVGSFFKNPWVDTAKCEELFVRFPKLVAYPAQGGFKLAAGWLIEQAGWKGYNADGHISSAAGVHSKQALVLVNPNRVAGAEVVKLARRIQESIAAKFGVELEIEPYVVAEVI